ncbi:MAG: glycerol-3-phosphate 1-O-acyltransferase PlsY [Dehalococcoidia bacterium]|nr:glycerol-3-phosphate 1-O-acyltransferase PlsY [Dehalococcoidia bacterium]
MPLFFWVSVFLAYFLGAIPIGVLISRKFSKVDVRLYGSGNTGAANVLRTSGKAAGGLVFLGDMMKGSAAVLAAGWIVGDASFAAGGLLFNADIARVTAGLAAIIGHNWSVFLKFHGGKGVSTFFGSLVTMSPLIGLTSGAVTIIVMAIFRYVSLGSILGAVFSVVFLLPLTVLGWQSEIFFFFTLPAMAVIVVQHRTNIHRLLSGTETKLGEKGKPVFKP